MKEVFKEEPDHRIYPFHFMCDTGLLEEIKDVLLGKESAVEERTRGFSTHGSTAPHDGQHHPRWLRRRPLHK